MALSTQITRLSPDCVRIRIYNEGSARPQGSALNRYGFIFEEEMKREGAPQLEIVQKCAECGALEAQDGAGRLLFKLTGVDFSQKGAEARFELFDPDEEWIGFGDQTRKRLFHRGFKANCQLSNVTSYVPVPMFLSTRGYALLVNTTYDVRFDMGCSNPAEFSWLSKGGQIDFYVWSSSLKSAPLHT